MADEHHAGRAADYVRDVAAHVRADHEHGASWLARSAASALDAAAALALADAPSAGGVSDDDLRRFWQAARELVRARPSMAAIATTVGRVSAAARPLGGERPPTATDALARLRAEAQRLASAWDAAAGAITAHARAVLHGAVLSHSRSGTVEEVLARLAAEGHLKALTVTTSQPGGEGVALAQSLARGGLEVTLVADAAMGWVTGAVDAVVLGADSVRADGSLVNKIGSLPLALSARHAGVPLYVLCESLKIAPAGWPLVLEEMDASELLPAMGARLHARNPYFDHTPADLITAIITEMGPLSREQIAQMADAAARDLAALDGM